MFRPWALRRVLVLSSLLQAGCTLNDPIDRVTRPIQEQPRDASSPDAATVPGNTDAGDDGRDSGKLEPDDGPSATCDDGEARTCGPDTEDGICNLGLRICENGAWGECVDAVYPAERDCRSSKDNDCDGQPDNLAGGPCLCVPESSEPCDAHPGLDGRGPCHAGMRTCVATQGGLASEWGPCQGSVGPAAADSCAIEGDDANCSGVPNDGCVCVEGRQTRCGPATDRGICAYGYAMCTGGRLGECVGAILPTTRDCFAPRDVDNDCDGIADNTLDSACTCQQGTTQACNTHPGFDGIGQCSAGVRTCVLGPTGATSAFGSCVGGVGPARDCSSTLDHDCNGVPDNTLDAICACVPGVATNVACDPPPVGHAFPPCTAGQRQCVPGPGNSSSTLGVCVGAVAPLLADSCAVAGNDATCDGVPNGGCQCVTGLGNAGCSTRPTASVCIAPGVCTACQLPADCALVTGLNVCSAGTCVECTAADTRACAANEVCENQVCVPLPVVEVAPLCGACTADVSCGPSARCVAQRLGSGSFCFPLAVGGVCATAPFATATAATSVSGAAASVCLPRATTCQALADLDTKLCTGVAGVPDHSVCGLPLVDDGLCVLTPATGASGRCSVPCAPASIDCPRGACVAGACAVTGAVLPVPPVPPVP